MGQPHKHAEIIKAWADGAEVEFRAIREQSWSKLEGPFFYLDFEYRIKPEPPANVYPVTGMHSTALERIYNDTSSNGHDLVNVANAALRHAIDSGIVSYPACTLTYYSGIPERNAARDMVVAEAIRNACLDNFDVSLKKISIETAKEWICEIDLAEIIATVKD